MNEEKGCKDCRYSNYYLEDDYELTPLLRVRRTGYCRYHLSPMSSLCRQVKLREVPLPILTGDLSL